MDYATLKPQAAIDKTLKAAAERNFSVQFVQNKTEAVEAIKKLIPAGAEVMTGSSTTLDQIGFTDILKSGDHPWKNLKTEILAEKDPAKQNELRKKSVLSEYFLGSVHAITEAGEILVASASGSQLPSYAFTSDNVIWVVGAQKIVPTLADGFKRIEEYVFPLEDKRMKSLGAPGSTIAKILIFNKEIMPNRKIHLILINEILGF